MEGQKPLDDKKFNGAQREVDTLITGALVLTMDRDHRILEDGAVAVEGGLILEVGPSRELEERYRARRLVDARRKLVMPGLINAHTHAPMNIFRGFADDLPLDAWLFDHIFPLEAQFVNASNVRLGTRLAIAEMLRSGTTTFNDMYFHTDVMAEEVDRAGVRAILTHALLDKPAHNGSSLDENLHMVEEIMQQYKSHQRIGMGFAVHAPYSARPPVYRKAKELADKYSTQLHTHLSETVWEVETIQREYGRSPVGHLDNIGVLGPNVVAAHAIHLTPRDMEILAHRQVGVAHNPQCNMKLANGSAPIPALLKMGVKVGIGTDGVASNNDLDLFDEIRSAALAQKLVSGDPTVMDARTVLETVTLGGARLLGMEDRIGSLESGKQADLIVIDLGQPHAWPHFDIYSLIVYSLRGSDVESVMVHGRILMEDRQLQTIDASLLYDDVMALRDQIRHWWTARSRTRTGA